MNEAVYPFYILHQAIIVIISFYVVAVNDSIINKYLFIVAATFGLTMAIFHFIIRPNSIFRFLFGMKKKSIVPISNKLVIPDAALQKEIA